MKSLSETELKEIEEIKILKTEGQLEQALNKVNKLEKKSELSMESLLPVFLLKSSILFDLGHLNEAMELAEKTLDDSERLKLYECTIEALNLIAWVLWRLGKLHEALDSIKKAEELVKIHFPEPSKSLLNKQASLYLIKGGIHFARGNLNLIKESLEEGLKIAKKAENNKLIMQFTVNTGTYYGIKGNLEKAAEYHHEALTVAEELNDIQNIIIALNNLGWVYRMQGKLDKAYEKINESYVLCKKTNSSKIHIILDSLFHVALDKEDLNLAREYLEEMKRLEDSSQEYEIIQQDYQINKALLLKANPRVKNLSKAEKILKKAVEQEVVLYEAYVDALLNLCDLLLLDLRNTNDLEILKEIQPYISRLLKIAEQNNSYPLIAETKLLQARLALLTFNIKDSRQLLSEAQDIAEKYGFNRLSMKISNEHDDLLKHLDVWETLKNSDCSFEERIKLTQIEDHMKRLIQKRTVEISESMDEEPLLLLVMGEGGVPAFSHIFSHEWDFSDELISGFLTTFDSISKELFSEGLDRAKFGQHTILMEPVGNFLVCYLFKGQSYYAKQKLEYFAGNMKKSRDVWQKFDEFSESCKTIKMHEAPHLSNLITESFLNTEGWLLRE
ncbi:MAG: tetratricopeptide repeat protein [Candidatus Lokiarchaeota archaeon]